MLSSPQKEFVTQDDTRDNTFAVNERRTANQSAQPCTPRNNDMMSKTQAEGFGVTQKSRSKLYLRMLMRLTEKFGANDLIAPIIKRSLDTYLK